MQQLHFHRDLLHEIQSLDEADADLIVQRFLEQRPPREIARAMDLPVVTVRKRLSRALDRLRRRLADSERGPEGWSLGLGIILGRPLAPTAGTSSSAPLEAAPVSSAVRTGSAGPWTVAGFTLGTLGLGVTWLLLGTGDHRSSQEGSREGALAAVEPTRSAPPVRADLPSVPGGMDRQTGAATSAAASWIRRDPSTQAATSTVRFVDEAGVAVRGVRAIWGDVDSTPNVMDVDEAGQAPLPRGAGGWIYAGADGYENGDYEVEWTESADMPVVLRRERTIRGQVLVDGVAPGRELALWRDRYSMNHWPSSASGDERMRAALLAHGLDWPRGIVRTDLEGRFTFTTRTRWSSYFLRLPADLRLVDAEGTHALSADNLSRQAARIRFDRSAESLMLFTESTPYATARFVDAVSGDPLQGVADVRVESVAGQLLGSTLRTPLSPRGELRLPVQMFGREPLDCRAYEIQLGESVVRASLAESGVPEDLGTFEVAQAGWASFLVRARSEDGLQPLRAVIESNEASVWTTNDGRARLRAATGSTLRVLAPGFGFRELVVQPASKSAETPQVIELTPASRLRVRFDLGTSMGFDPAKSVDIKLMFHGQALSGLVRPDDEDDARSFPYGLVHGAQFKGRVGSEEAWDDGLYFRGVPGRDLWIDGLRPGARVLVAALDRVGGVLASKEVVMPRAGDASGIDVNFGDLYDAGAACLLAEVRWPGSGRAYGGWIGLVTPAGRVESLRASGGGRLELGPLAPGRYRLVARENPSTPRDGEGLEVVALPGLNELRIDAVGVEPD